jgi:hypothetical protein
MMTALRLQAVGGYAAPTRDGSFPRVPRPCFIATEVALPWV